MLPYQSYINNVGSLECLLLNKVFRFHLNWRCSGSFAKIMHIIPGMPKELCWPLTSIVSHLISKLNIEPVWWHCGLWIFPYCFWRSAIAFLWQSALSFMTKNLTNFCGSFSSVFDMLSYLSLQIIFFSTDPWNINMNCVKSSGFPLNGSKSNCLIALALSLIAFPQHYHFHVLIFVLFTCW